MGRPRIYLSHSVFERRKGGRVQRKLEEMGYTVVNPFYPQIGRGDVRRLDEGEWAP